MWAGRIPVYLHMQINQFHTGTTPASPLTPCKGKHTPFFPPGSPQAHSSPTRSLRRTLFTTPSRSGKKRPASPDSSPDLTEQVNNIPSKKVCPESKVKTTKARNRLPYDQNTPGQTSTPAFEEPMEETSAPPPTTSFTDTPVTATFSLITGKMTNHIGERITKAFRGYIGSDGTQAAPRLVNWSVSFIIRSALLTKASRFVNQSLGLPDLRFTTSKKQQTGESRNAQNTPKHTSKGIIDTHLTATEFAKKIQHE